MSEHTPGPWTVRDTKDKSSFAKDWREIKAAGRSVVVAGWYFHGDETECGVRISEQDARLIAAAPDLLAALRGLLRDLDATEEEPGQDAIADARAAIEKAEGKP